MLNIPLEINRKYDEILTSKGVDRKLHGPYKKWLRFYLDFCSKYNHQSYQALSLSHFQQKLLSKGQSSYSREQATYAVSLFLNMHVGVAGTAISAKNANARSIGAEPVVTVAEPRLATQNEYSSSVSGEPYHGGRSWVSVYQRLAEEVKLRHYSPKTLRAYRNWIRKYQTFLKSKDVNQLTQSDVKAFLTYLAVEKGVAASTQNQAFNALLFLYRHVLRQEFGKIEGVTRAKKSTHIPVVLSRREIDSVLSHLNNPYQLAVKLLYGCGLRLSECLQLRLNDFNLDMNTLTIRNGKGKKGRTLPLPESIKQEILLQIDQAKALHCEDMSDQYAGVFLPDRLEVKYPKAATELAWQWFFPAKVLTTVPSTGEKKRFHLHETHLQRAIKRAVGEAKLLKRASAHTFRHSFASHLLQANYDIHTIQAMMGHSDIRTTIVYLKTVPSVTIKEAKSPLDITLS